MKRGHLHSKVTISEVWVTKATISIRHPQKWTTATEVISKLVKVEREQDDGPIP